MGLRLGDGSTEGAGTAGAAGAYLTIRGPRVRPLTRANAEPVAHPSTAAAPVAAAACSGTVRLSLSQGEGATGVSAFITHAVFPNAAWKNFIDDGWDSVYVTDSIPETAKDLTGNLLPCPATVPLTPGASFNGICNRQ